MLLADLAFADAQASADEKLAVYPAPPEVELISGFEVRVRTAGGEWRDVPVLPVKVKAVRGMNAETVETPSMAFFEFAGEGEAAVTTLRRGWIESARVQPLSRKIEPEIAGNRLSFRRAKPESPGKWSDYKIGNFGEIEIKSRGELPVVAKPPSIPRGFVMNLRSIRLVPAGAPTTVTDIRDEPIAQADDGLVKLTATNAEIDGRAVRLEGGETKYLAWWNSPERSIKWPILHDDPMSMLPTRK